MRRIADLGRQMARRTQSAERRQDAHEKIVLGGLVVKAGLRNADPAFILGALIFAAGRLDDGEFKARMIDIGRKGFRQ